MTDVPILEALPGPLDLAVYRGNGVDFSITLKDTTTGDLLSLPTTGWRSQARIDLDPASPLLFTIIVDGSNAGSGVVNVHINGADTVTIEDTAVAWDLENTETDRTYVAGKIRLSGQVTR